MRARFLTKSNKILSLQLFLHRNVGWNCSANDFCCCFAVILSGLSCLCFGALFIFNKAAGPEEFSSGLLLL